MHTARGHLGNAFGEPHVEKCGCYGMLADIRSSETFVYRSGYANDRDLNATWNTYNCADTFTKSQLRVF
eukprot:scaffold6_cov330-Pavlova_lutheri.AAC.14